MASKSQYPQAVLDATWAHKKAVAKLAEAVNPRRQRR